MPVPGILVRLARSQSLAYTLVGCVNTAIGFLLFVVWITVLGDHLYQLAVALAYSISVVIAFVLHRTLVFRVRGRLVRDFVAFVGVNSGGFVLNIVLMTLAVGVLDLPPIPSQFVVTGIVAVTSYFGHRHVSFRRPPARSGDTGVVVSQTRG
ncbi:GtrA family protein [Antrihabitans sp. YC2-6]|nr:GtrA family protein [Antrihabitans sp. YC2-6]